MSSMENDKPDTLLSHYATKGDLQGVRVELQALRGDIQLLFAEMRAFRAEMQFQFQAQNQAMELLRADVERKIHEHGENMERSMHAQTWKMIGLVVAMNAASITVMYYIAG